MSTKRAASKNHSLSNYLIVGGLSLAFCLFAATASAQQDQQDTQAQSAPYQGSQQQAPLQQAVPQSLTVPAGTTIQVRTNEWLSSDRNLPGDEFSAVLDQPIVVDGWVIARRGQAETGRVSVATKAGRKSGTSQLGVELGDLTLVDGQQLPVQTQMLQSSAGTSHGQDAATIGTTTGIGAIIGAVADGGSGAAIGAGAGAAAGIIGVLATRGKPTVIPPETVLSFRLQAPVNISTEKSQFAFQPVTQADYESRTTDARPQHLAVPGRSEYPPPPVYYGYPYSYWYPYSYPYGYYPVPFSFGFYGGYGFGRGFGRFHRGGFRR
jgi:hypothetical protein